MGPSKTTLSLLPNLFSPPSPSISSLPLPPKLIHRILSKPYKYSNNQVYYNQQRGMLVESSDLNLHQLVTRSENFTNQVLVHEPAGGDKIIYYLPVYLRMTVRRVHHIELESSVAQISGTLIFSIYYHGIPDKLKFIDEYTEEPIESESNMPWYIAELMQKVELKINGQDGFIFSSSKDIFVENSLSISHDKKNRLLNYTIRDTFQADVDGNIALTPFQTLNLYTQFSLRTVECGYTTDKKKVQLKFNMMDTREDGIKLEIRMRANTGEYGIGEKMCSMVYTASGQAYNRHIHESYKCILGQPTGEYVTRQQGQLKKDKLQYWQHANVRLVLYKHPMTTIFSIMMPMWILAAIVQLSFFQENNLADRIGTVAIALVAYMAFIPSVREKLPPSPNFTFIEIVIVLLLFTSLLTAARAFIDSQSEAYEYLWYKDPLFLITLVMNSFTLVSTILIAILFHTIFKRTYTDDSPQVKKKDFKFRREDWMNHRADRLFQQHTVPVVSSKRGSVKLEPIQKKK